MVGRGIGELVAAADEFVTANEARIAARQAAGARGRVPDTVEGYLMEDVEAPAERAPASDRPSSSSQVELVSTVTFAALFLTLLALWRVRRRIAA
jgi:hypothetical protein